MNKVLGGAGFITFVWVVLTSSAWGAPPAKVLILPPILHGKAEMSFLQQGVVDMLTTRLAAIGGLMVATPDGQTPPRTAKNRADAVAQGRKYSVDYVVFGSLTLLGNGISTDLRMVAPADDRLALSFSRSGKDHAALISHMDQFVAQVDQKVLGNAPVSEAPKAAVQPKADQPARDLIHQHPEKLLASPMPTEQKASAGKIPSGGGVVAVGKQDTVRGPRIKDQIQSVALGDLTGDGHLESVFVGLHSVWIYRHVGSGRFARMAHLKGVGNYVGVDTADLDGDGRAEIFVTNVDNDDGQILSFVLGYNGRTFVRRAEQLDYYFRAIRLPQRGRVLMGQRSGIDEFFAPGIFEIAYQGDKYYSETRWQVPRRLNIFGVASGIFAPGDGAQLLAFSKSRNLELLTTAGTTVWKSPESFGGSSALLLRRNSIEYDQDIGGFRFLGARIETIDIDSDGVDEVVVMHNEDATGSVMRRTRYFKKGRMEVLKADTVGFVPYWHTPDMAKYVSDFALADLDGDGRMEIVAAVVLKVESALTAGQSQIYIFSIGKKAAAAEQQ